MTAPTTSSRTAWIEQPDCNLDDFRALLSARTDLADYPWPATIAELRNA